MPIPKQIKEVLPVQESQLIVLMKFGSKLYGTDGPDSDTDYKGIYMPTREQLLLNRLPRTASYHSKKTKEEGVRNSKDDIDIEIFSLHYFIDLACKGETVAIDMLHAPPYWPIETSDVWMKLQHLRRHFYTKNLSSFVGYARKQAAKYGIKGSRLNDAKRVLEYFETFTEARYPTASTVRLFETWNMLPEGEHIHKLEDDCPRMYQVCGKKLQETVTIQHAYDIIKKFYDEYGHRAKLAAQNEGIDWKAVSHAVRAAIQVSELLSWGFIAFPLRQADLVKGIKEGKYDYQSQVGPLLEMYMAQCEKLSELSNLPNAVNRAYWDSWLLEVLSQQFVEVVNDGNKEIQGSTGGTAV